MYYLKICYVINNMNKSSSDISIQNVIYKIHPIYNMYAGAKNGSVIHIKERNPLFGNKHTTGYLTCTVRISKEKQKGFFVHRFIYECFNGIIPKNKVIDHVNDIKSDNRLCNLQIMTQQENNLKSSKKRDYKFAAKNNKNRKCIKAINCSNLEESYFYSMYAVQKFLGINVGIVKMCCDKKNYVKSGKSKINGFYYSFEYIDQDKLPDNY